MKRQIPIVMLAIALATSLMPLPASAQATETVTAGATRCLDAQGTEKLTTQATTSCEFEEDDIVSGSVTWDASTNTVTMTDATLTLDSNYCGIYISGKGVKPKPTVTLKLIGANTIKDSAGAGDKAAVYVENANLSLVGSGSLTINCPGANSGVYCSGSFTASSGQINVQKSMNYGFEVGGALALKGASLVTSSGNAKNGAGIRADSATLSKGSLTVSGSGLFGISAEDLTASGASVSVSGRTQGISAENLKLSGNSSITVSNCKTSGIAFGESMTASAGSLSITKCGSGIVPSDDEASIAISGAKTKVTISSVDKYGIRFANKLTCKDGTLVIDGCKTGIYNEIENEDFSSGNMTVTGGTVKITNAKTAAIAVEGRLKITGGAVTAKCTSAKGKALYAYGMSGKATCVKSLQGKVIDEAGSGMDIKLKGNTYTINNGLARLKSYGASSKTPSIGKLTYGGIGYSIRSIGQKAFSTKQGKAVTSVKLGSNVSRIESQAFAGSSVKQVSLEASYLYFMSNAFSNTPKLAVMTLKARPASITLKAKALTKCGKASGLVVKCKRSADCSQMRQKFLKAGLTPKATFK